MEAVSISTIPEAREHIYSLIEHQLEKSTRDNTSPNTPVSGDTNVKNKFFLLLPPNEQRTVFLTTIRRREFWPRIKSLFGTPPYSFLKMGDAAALRAAGISPSRANMSYPQIRSPSSYEFGIPHYTDDFDRDFKILVTYNNINNNTLPFATLSTSERAVLDVRLKKQGKLTKSDIIRGRSSVLLRSFMFPRSGERLRLTPTQALKNVSQVVDVQVKSISIQHGSNRVSRMSVVII
tara:strand:+ start:1083 stop:1787 length:705 start_codon:yes stop_codon:yes gene_type:complete